MTPPVVTAARPFHGLDISTTAFWGRTFDERDGTFARLRATGGLTWHPPMDIDMPHEEAGFWAATRVADIVEISRRHDVFSSAQGISVPPLLKEFQEPATFFLMMDPPEHTLYRRLISSAFTPKNVARLEAQIAAGAREVVAGLVGAGDVDLVASCAAQLPMRTVCDMIGIPESQRPAVAAAAEVLFGGAAESGEDVDSVMHLFTQVEVLRNAAIEIAQDRRRRPADDLITAIVTAEVDGHRLTDEQIGAFMVLLCSAGSDTTRQTTAHTLLALGRHPEQKAWLAADFDARIGSALEEFVRWASPVMDFARFATQDARVGDVTVRAGDKVALFYCSGNRDGSVFDRPGEFRLDRSPNGHVGFGGGGVHYCLGNTLARTQLRALFREILTHLPDFEVGEPEYMTSTFVHGVRRLPGHV